jgi:hypothetical protein
MNLEEFINANIWVILVAALWSLPWKGIALWKAARLKDKGWFIIILIVNTLAVLEIIYIYIISKKKVSPDQTAK